MKPTDIVTSLDSGSTTDRHRCHLALTLAVTVNLDLELDFQSPTSCGHDPYRNVRRILVREINAHLPPKANFFFENLTTKWCILKYI